MAKKNLFALIEIKFPGDKVKKEQFDQYDKLSIECAKVKTGIVTASRTNGRDGVIRGCRIALFRYPEDVAVDSQEEDKPKKSPPKPNKKGGR
jgi:hypothetical protein